MANLFKVQIFTQERLILEDEITSLVLPGADGYFGILAHHAPLVATLGQGTMRVKKFDDERTYEIFGGFVEVVDNVVTILADAVGEPVDA